MSIKIAVSKQKGFPPAKTTFSTGLLLLEYYFFKASNFLLISSSPKNLNLFSNGQGLQ